MGGAFIRNSNIQIDAKIQGFSHNDTAVAEPKHYLNSKPIVELANVCGKLL